MSSGRTSRPQKDCVAPRACEVLNSSLLAALQRLEVTFARLMVMPSRAAKARLELLFLRVLSRCASRFRRRFMACNASRDFIPTRDVFQATKDSGAWAARK
jgi:hypothetical protein